MMKRIALIILLAFATQPASANAEGAGAGFSISPGFSILYGSIQEYVYIDGKRASRLDWDIKPLFLAGMAFSGTYSNFRAGGEFFFALNENTGHIHNYDWDTSTGVLTNYSKHNVRQRGSVFADASLSYLFRPSDRLSLLPGLGLGYTFLQLTAEDGHLEYPPGSSPVAVFGRGIIYEQIYIIPYAVFAAEYRAESLDFMIAFAYSPLALCNARDSHLKKDIDYYDTIRYAQYFRLVAGATCRISGLVGLSVALTGVYIPETRGDSYFIDTATGARSPTFSDGCGIRTRYVALTLSADIRIF